VTPEADGPLQRAQASLAATDGELSALLDARAVALAADDDVRAMELDGEIAAKERLRKVQLDKVGLRQAEAQREAAAQAVQVREAQIVEVSHLFEARDAAVADLRDHLVAAEAAFRRVHELGQAARAAWPWPHGRVGATLTAASDLTQAVSAFLFKIGGRPSQTGGLHQASVPPAFPGGRCPQISLLQTPDRLPDLVAQYRDASRYASDVMRNVRVPVPPEPLSKGAVSSSASPGDAAPSNVEPLPTRTGNDFPVAPQGAVPNPELARLLSRQNMLAMRDMSPADEVEYAEIGQQIAAIS
jgi:hypothetical protein